jgi:hypothetical protein
MTGTVALATIVVPLYKFTMVLYQSPVNIKPLLVSVSLPGPMKLGSNLPVAGGVK